MRLTSYSLYKYGQLIADSSNKMILNQDSRRNFDRRIPRVTLKITKNQLLDICTIY